LSSSGARLVEPSTNESKFKGSNPAWASTGCKCGTKSFEAKKETCFLGLKCNTSLFLAGLEANHGWYWQKQFTNFLRPLVWQGVPYPKRDHAILGQPFLLKPPTWLGNDRKNIVGSVLNTGPAFETDTTTYFKIEF